MKKFTAFVIALMICGSLFATTYKTPVLDDFDDPTDKYWYVCYSDEFSIQGNLTSSGCVIMIASTEDLIDIRIMDNYGNPIYYNHGSSVSIKIKGMTTNEIVELNFVTEYSNFRGIEYDNTFKEYCQMKELFNANKDVKVAIIDTDSNSATWGNGWWKVIATLNDIDFLFSEF